ncbi:MAG: hypothetical protein DRI61_15555, partial [Chloroflexi bacterium]
MVFLDGRTTAGAFSIRSYEQTGDYSANLSINYTAAPTNNAPVINLDTESPTDESTDNSAPITISVDIDDSDGDSIDWWLNASEDGNRSYYNVDSGTDSDGDYTISESFDGSDYNATYYWMVHVTDGTDSDTEYFSFQIEQNSWDSTGWLTADTCTAVGWLNAAGDGVPVASDLNADDSAYAKDTLTSSTDTGYLNLTDFDVSIPSGSDIHSVQVKIIEYANQGSVVYHNYSKLLDASGSPTGDNITTGNDGIIVLQATYETNLLPLNGSTECDWGASLTETMVEDTDFGVSLKWGFDGGGGREVRVDYVAINITYSE